MELRYSWRALACTAVLMSACAEEATQLTEPPPRRCPEGISATPASASLHIGDTLRLRAVVFWSCRSLSDASVYWRSQNPQVAAIDSLSGLVRARALGSSTMIARANADPNFAAGVQVNVVP